MVDLHALKSDIGQPIYNIYMKQRNEIIYVYTEKPAMFVLYDVLGNKVREEKLMTGENKMLIPEHTKGILIAYIYENNQIHLTQKILRF